MTIPAGRVLALGVLFLGCHTRGSDQDTGARPSMGEGDASRLDELTAQENVDASPSRASPATPSASSDNITAAPAPTSTLPTRGAPLVFIPSADLHRCDLPRLPTPRGSRLRSAEARYFMWKRFGWMFAKRRWATTKRR